MAALSVQNRGSRHRQAYVVLVCQLCQPPAQRLIASHAPDTAKRFPRTTRQGMVDTSCQCLKHRVLITCGEIRLRGWTADIRAGTAKMI